MNEVELALWQLIGEHIVDSHFKVWMLQFPQDRRVKVSREHRSPRVGAVAQPSRHGATAGAYLQAAPPRPHTKPLKQPERAVVQQRRQ